MPEERRLAAIMFTDMVGYTALMGSDEVRARELVERSRTHIRSFVERFHGRWLEEIGDGTLSAFSSAAQAADCALAIQGSLQDEPELSLRIGIHLGDVVFADGRVYGDGVNVASRIEGLAPPGGVAVSEPVCSAIRGHARVRPRYLGKRKLKNVDEPVRVFTLQDASTEDTAIHGMVRGLWTRRVPHVLAAYAVASAGLVVLARWLTAWYGRYGQWVDDLLVVLAAMTPAVVAVMFLRPGPGRAKRAHDSESPGHPSPSTDSLNLSDSRRLVVASLPMAVLIVSLAGVSWWVYQTVRGDLDIVPEMPVVGVAAFVNQTGDPDLDWYGRGVARLVSDNLSQSRYLRVVSIERMAALAASVEANDGLLEVAGQAGIDYVLTGEILPAPEPGPGNVMLAARLLDTEHGNQVATGRRDGLPAEDLLAASDDIALAARRGLGVPLAEVADSYIADFAAANPDAYESYIEGLRAFNRYRYDEAETAFSRALDQASDFTMARYRLAHVVAAQGRTDEAVDLIRKAVAETERLSDREARYVRAAQALIERRYPDAVQKYQEIIELYPYETEARRHLAEIYFSLQQPDQAAAVARDLERLAPEAPTTWSLLGWAYLSKKDYSRAVQSLQRYVQLAPDEPNAHHLLADSYRAQGEFGLAVAEYRKALELDADFHFATVDLAKTQVLRDRLDMAAALLKPVVSNLNVPPRHRIGAGFALAHVRRAQGRFTDADLVLAALEQPLADEQVREAMGLSVRGTSLMEAGDLSSARTLTARAVQLSPGPPTRYLFAQGLVQLREGRLDEVQSTANSILEEALPPDNPDRTEEKAAAYLRGMALLAEGNAESALQEFSEAVALSGYEYRIYRLGLARAYLGAGLLEEAAAAARDAAGVVDLADPRLDLELDRRRALLVLAEVEHALGRTANANERARELLESWSGADPEFRDLARARELVAGADG